MNASSVTGAVMLGGLVAFMTGAVRWQLRYEGALEDSLPPIHADRRRRAWIHAWMIAGVLVTSAGLAAFATMDDPTAAPAVATMAATIYIIGAACWIVALAFRLAVVPWAAERLVGHGCVPDGFIALDAWAGSLYKIHMLASYFSFAVLGGAVIIGGTLPSWLGWVGVGWGALFLVGISFGGRFAAAFFPPFWAHAYTAVVGVALLAT